MQSVGVLACVFYLYTQVDGDWQTNLFLGQGVLTSTTWNYYRLDPGTSITVGPTQTWALLNITACSA